ncbi:MAG: hypothetical protein IKJ68_07930 [Clostridia bacterium]|nr:hypothetical protein [Clostridia bacterium]
MFLKGFMKKLGVFCVMGFVVGVFFAFIMPPIVIAIVEGVLLALLCLCLICN